MAGKVHLPSSSGSSVRCQPARFTEVPPAFWSSIQSDESPSVSHMAPPLAAMNSVIKTLSDADELETTTASRQRSKAVAFTVWLATRLWHNDRLDTRTAG